MTHDPDDIPDIDIELPGLDEVLRAEIGLVREDVERLERQFASTCGALASVGAEMAALKARFRALKARQDELSTQAATERRLLRTRRRVLFDMEEETR